MRRKRRKSRKMKEKIGMIPDKKGGKEGKVDPVDSL